MLLQLASARAIPQRKASSLLQIAYFSTAARVQDAKTVHDILIQSRVNNRRDGITGLLIAGGNRYMQIIEGPAFAAEPVRQDPQGPAAPRRFHADEPQHLPAQLRGLVDGLSP
jgi:hypothetical protein